MKNKNIPGFNPNAGFANHNGNTPPTLEEAVEYNDHLRATAEALESNKSTEEVFAGAMNMLGLHGQEHDGQFPSDSYREFVSERDDDSLELALCEFHVGAANGEVVRRQSNESETPVAVEINDRFDFANEGTGPVGADRKTRVTTIKLLPKNGKGAVKRPVEGGLEAPFIPLNGKRQGEVKRVPGSAVSHIPDRLERGEAYYGADEQLEDVNVTLLDGKPAGISWKRVNAEKAEHYDIAKIREQVRAGEGPSSGIRIVEKQIDGLLERVRGMMEVANATLEKEKAARQQAAKDMAQVLKNTRDRVSADFVDSEM